MSPNDPPIVIKTTNVANRACVQGGHDDYVFLYFADDQLESRSVLLL